MKTLYCFKLRVQFKYLILSLNHTLSLSIQYLKKTYPLMYIQEYNILLFLAYLTMSILHALTIIYLKKTLHKHNYYIYHFFETVQNISTFHNTTYQNSMLRKTNHLLRIPIVY